MGRRFRNEKRIAPAGVLIADRFERRNIDIRTVHIDGGRAEVPDLMNLRNRAAGGIGAGGIALIQPAVDGHGQIVYRPSGGGDRLHITGNMIGGEDFLRGGPKGLRPGAAARSAFHRRADILRHGAGMGFHVFQKIGGNRCCKDGVRGIRNLPGCPQQTGFIFDLDRQNSLLPAVCLFQKCHERTESPRIGLHGFRTQVGKRCIVDFHRNGRRHLTSRFVFPFFDLGTGEALQILLHPGWRVHAFGILPAAEPEEDNVHVPEPGLADQRLGNREIEVPLFGFRHRPGDRQQQRIHAHALSQLPDMLHISRRRGVRVVHLSRQHDKGFSLYGQHFSVSNGFDFRHLRPSFREFFSEKKFVTYSVFPFSTEAFFSAGQDKK